MISNPFKYVPAINSHTYTNRYSLESRWGYTVYDSKYELESKYSTVLIPKEIHKRVKIMTTPIDMKKYLELRNTIESQMFSKMFNGEVVNTVLKNKMTVDISEEYEEEYEKVKKEWAIRMKAAGGQFLMQYNAKVGLLGDSWIRMVQGCLNESTGEMNEDWRSYKKISWLRYFFVETLLILITKTYCKLNNLYYRKEIAKEHKYKRAELDRCFEENKMMADIKEKVDNESDTTKNSGS